MKKKRNIFQILGFLLIFLSLAVLGGREVLGIWSSQRSEALLQRIEPMLPPRTAGIPEARSDPDMPVLQLDGEDFCAIVSVPSFGVTLPVGNEWSEGPFMLYPHRFWGGVYDHSLIIGGSGGKGQFDFFGRLDLGDRVVITDMTGAQYSYEVGRIDRSRHVDMQTLRKTESDLILFARDETSLDHIIVRCIYSPYAG